MDELSISKCQFLAGALIVVPLKYQASKMAEIAKRYANGDKERAHAYIKQMKTALKERLKTRIEVLSREGNGFFKEQVRDLQIMLVAYELNKNFC